MGSRLLVLLGEERGSIVLKGVLAGVLTIIVFSLIAAVFVFTTGDDVSTGHPNVQAQVDYDGTGEFVVRHNGGSTITGQNTREIKVIGDVETFGQTSTRINIGEEYTSGDVLFRQTNVTLEAGDSVQILLIANEDGSEVPIGNYEL